MSSSGPDFWPFFPLLFVGLWLVIGMTLSALAGWYGLASAFPNRKERAIRTVRFQSGSMGLGVSFNGILTLSACPSGLRVAVWRMFGPFSKPFLVPWSQINATETRRFFIIRTRLGFGSPEVGRLTLEPAAWLKLRQASPGWDSSQDLLPATANAHLLQTLLIQWAAFTAIAGAFFYLAGHQMQGGGLSAAMCFGFPAVLFGIGQGFRYFTQRL